MAFCNLDLLFRDVAAHLNDLHAVEQRTRNGVEVVGGSNEEHLREVIVDIEIVVMERVVLFRVKNLKQRR